MAVQAEVDWRLPVFEAGKYLVAFDGAALLLLELWRRQQAACRIGGLNGTEPALAQEKTHEQ